MFDFRRRPLRGIALAAALTLAPAGAVLAESEQQSLEELRNTVINLLQALVEQGVMTRAKAEELVKQAQAKAAETAAAKARADEGAIRVPYVPQIIKDEISKQVAQEVKPQVVADVREQAKSEGWGVPAALPDWLRHVRVFGDVTVRGQSDLYPRDNAQNYFLDFQSINTAGGFSKAGVNAFLNVSEDRERMRLRARLGAEAQLGSEVSAGIRLSSGALTDPSSPSPTLGNYADRATVGFDEAYLRWDPKTADGFNYFTAVGGRILNPWFAPTELVFAADLTFEGAALSGRIPFGDGGGDQSNAFLTLAAMPIQEVSFANPHSKWLLGAQLGTLIRVDDDQRFRLAGAYYDFSRISGVRNAPDSILVNYTAPLFIRYGNTVFDISNSTTDPTINLFGLAANFRLADVAASYEIPVRRYVVRITADAVRNVGDTARSLFARTGAPLAVKRNGWVGDITFGDPVLKDWGTWRAKVGYRYVQADAVLDAWTDADFHGGGTNARGYFIWTEFGLTPALSTRLRWLSANEVDGPHFGYDIIQLDFIGRF